MTLPARAAVVRGDDLQYTLAWHHACEAITTPGVESVHVENAGAGSFDDVVVRRHDGRHLYLQIKNSNYSDVVIDQSWLLTAKGNGASPLQHFYDSWDRLRLDGSPTFELVANRGVDHTDPLLKLLDRNTNLLVPKAVEAKPRSHARGALNRWAAALDIEIDQLLLFLRDFRIVVTHNEARWRSTTKPLMHLAGLRHDDEAVRIGVDIVREWVKNGVGPRTPAQIRHDAADANLLARDGRVVLAVHAIDRPGSANLPTITLDWVDRFAGDTPRGRRLLRDAADWSSIAADLAKAEKVLGEFGVRHVLVEGAMRLPLWFAVGAAFPDTRGWELEVQQRDALWSSVRAEPKSGDTARLTKVERTSNGSTDVAVVVALTSDATADVASFVAANRLAGTVLALTTQMGPGQDSVRDGAHARAWARSARQLLRDEIRKLPTRPGRLHLFLAAPAGAAILLGHDWNLLPETLVYEHTDPGYAPTLIVD